MPSWPGTRITLCANGSTRPLPPSANRPASLPAPTREAPMKRNLVNFTRGSQLLGHFGFMFAAGLKGPLLIVIAVISHLSWWMLSGGLTDHETRSEAHQSEIQSLMSSQYVDFGLQ